MDVNKFDLKGLILKYCKLRDYPEDYTRNWFAHEERIRQTLLWLSFLKNRHIKVLELGDSTIVTDILREVYGIDTPDNTNFDLRYTFPIEDNKYDLILSMEVLEHLADPPDNQLNSLVTLSGLKNCLKECYSILAPNGFFFFTTPNIVSLYPLHLILLGNFPFMADIHFMEYTPDAIQRYCRDAGFKEVRFDTVNSWSLFHKLNYKRLEELITSYGGPLSLRGDDIFYLGTK